jgi:uncharacterized RDD family membrane protein YckC
LGFDSGDRCKNCGYDFSLIDHGGGRAARTPPPGPPLDESPPRDPRLARGSRYRHGGAAPVGLGVDRPLSGQPEGTPVDLPLFGGGASASIPPSPRPPLAVRRSTPMPTPARIRPRPPSPQIEALPLGLEEPAAAVDPALAAGDAGPASRASRADASVCTPATAGRRATAAAIDVGLIVVIDLIVLHFTLAICGLTLNDVHILPVVPMVAFLLILNGGYVVLFTGTLGQTLGKMAASIEVVSDRQGGMDLARAGLRGAAMILSLLPAGLGWVAALVGDHRGLHDRLAGTRVVRVPGP